MSAFKRCDKAWVVDNELTYPCIILSPIENGEVKVSKYANGLRTTINVSGTLVQKRNLDVSYDIYTNRGQYIPNDGEQEW